ncbi:MAG: hypothetical protein NVS2B9_19910 [Myxococcales bacterium]
MAPEPAAGAGTASGPPGRARGSRWVLAAILGLPVLLFAVAGLRAVDLAREGEVPAALRDLDCDGRVTFAEWLRAGIDFRLRASELVAGCQDVFAVKTGRAIVVRCPSDPACRLARDLPR